MDERPGSGSQPPARRPGVPVPPRPPQAIRPPARGTGPLRGTGPVRPGTGRLPAPPAERPEAAPTREEAQSMQRLELILAYAQDLAAGRSAGDAMSLYKLFMDEFAYQDERKRGMRAILADLTAGVPDDGTGATPADIPRLEASIAACEDRIALLKRLAKQAIAAR